MKEIAKEDLNELNEGIEEVHREGDGARKLALLRSVAIGVGRRGLVGEEGFMRETGKGSNGFAHQLTPIQLDK